MTKQSLKERDNDCELNPCEFIGTQRLLDENIRKLYSKAVQKLKYERKEKLELLHLNHGGACEPHGVWHEARYYLLASSQIEVQGRDGYYKVYDHLGRRIGRKKKPPAFSHLGEINLDQLMEGYSGLGLPPGELTEEEEEVFSVHDTGRSYSGLLESFQWNNLSCSDAFPVYEALYAYVRER